ncbi:MAG: type II toxin-antitoxin system VapC family toxin [Sulfuricellaceae bacterium]|nr:type II toxin-antitoxin system VapC family toxin [Sulfuricellaceae bacterium]
MVLADSNILIYATQPEYSKLRQWLLDTLPKVSIISRVEILGYHKQQEAEQAALTELLDNLELVYLTPACYEIAIQLRQRQKLTLGDALIAATCLEQGYTLATANTSDFAWIDELTAFNPLEAG